MPSFDVVALFNSNPDAIVLITRLLESAGFTVVPALIPEVRDGRCDVDALMTDHDPSVVVYEIGPPARRTLGDVRGGSRTAVHA